MTEEEFIIDNVGEIQRKRSSYLKVGDHVKIVTSFGEVEVDDAVVTREVNSYVIIDNKKFWKRGLDGKHRCNQNYMLFAMTPKDAMLYITSKKMPVIMGLTEEEFYSKTRKKKDGYTRNTSSIQRGRRG